MAEQHEDGRSGPEWMYKRLHHAYRLASDAVFEEYGVKEFGQPMILLILERLGVGGVIATQKELSERLGVSQTTTAISLKSLERLGCICKKSDQKDMRRNQIEITDRGIEVANKFRKAFDHINRSMYGGFSDEEKDLISSFFLRMTKNLMRIANPTEGDETDS